LVHVPAIDVGLLEANRFVDSVSTEDLLSEGERQGSSAAPEPFCNGFGVIGICNIKSVWWMVRESFTQE
jgi:hypothetical protein